MITLLIAITVVVYVGGAYILYRAFKGLRKDQEKLRQLENEKPC